METLVEQDIRTSQGSAVAALRQAISDALVDEVDCRLRLPTSQAASIWPLVLELFPIVENLLKFPNET